MKKLLLLLLLIPNLVMGENLSLVCKGIKETSNAKFSDSTQETRTYVFRGGNLIKAEEEGIGWKCDWSDEEIQCFALLQPGRGIRSRITLDRLQGTVDSHYVTPRVGNRLGWGNNFEGLCKAAKNKKF